MPPRVSPSSGAVLTRGLSELQLQGLPTEHDVRPVETIVEAAAAASGLQGAKAPLLEALAQHGVQAAWQLQLADPEDWQAFAAPIGLKIAVKAELLKATIDQGVPMSELLRHFLLLPAADGTPPKRLRSIAAPFLSLLLVKPAERQGLMLKTFELTGVVSGLLLTVPIAILEFTERDAAQTGQADETIEEGWMDALAGFVFVNLALVTTICINSAMFVVSSGWQASTRYYEALMPIIGVTFHLFAYGGVFPLTVLVLNRLLLWAGSPVPVLVLNVWSFVMSQCSTHFLWSFHIKGMALELYHFPCWLMSIIRVTCAPLHFCRLSDAALEGPARQRALELRQLAGICESVVK